LPAPAGLPVYRSSGSDREPCGLPKGDLEEIRTALRLFDEVIGGAVEGVDDRNPHSSITLEYAAEFAPPFIDGLLESVENLKQTWRSDPYRKFIGEQFEPLKPLLKRLQRAISQPEWPRDDLSLGEVLLIVDHFKDVIEEGWQT
jgi:hypothetical protein